MASPIVRAITKLSEADDAQSSTATLALAAAAVTAVPSAGNDVARKTEIDGVSASASYAITQAGIANAAISAHEADTGNPHDVTAAQVGSLPGENLLEYGAVADPGDDSTDSTAALAAAIAACKSNGTRRVVVPPGIFRTSKQTGLDAGIVIEGTGAITSGFDTNFSCLKLIPNSGDTNDCIFEITGSAQAVATNFRGLKLLGPGQTSGSNCGILIHDTSGGASTELFWQDLVITDFGKHGICFGPLGDPGTADTGEANALYSSTFRNIRTERCGDHHIRCLLAKPNVSFENIAFFEVRGAGYGSYSPTTQAFGLYINSGDVKANLNSDSLGTLGGYCYFGSGSIVFDHCYMENWTKQGYYIGLKAKATWISSTINTSSSLAETGSLPIYLEDQVRAVLVNCTFGLDATPVHGEFIHVDGYANIIIHGGMTISGGVNSSPPSTYWSLSYGASKKLMESEPYFMNGDLAFYTRLFKTDTEYVGTSNPNLIQLGGVTFCQVGSYGGGGPYLGYNATYDSVTDNRMEHVTTGSASALTFDANINFFVNGSQAGGSAMTRLGVFGTGGFTSPSGLGFDILLGNGVAGKRIGFYDINSYYATASNGYEIHTADRVRLIGPTNVEILRADETTATFAGTVVGSTFSGSGASLTGLTKSQVGLGSVENTALSTWAGSTNVTTLGTIGTGTWQGSAVGVPYGGSGVTAATTGGIVVGSGTNTRSELAANSTATKKFLSMTSSSAAWAQPASSDLSDASNVALLNAANAFTNNQTITKTTEQLRLAYDSTHFTTFTVATDGGPTIDSNSNTFIVLGASNVAGGVVINRTSGLQIRGGPLGFGAALSGADVFVNRNAAGVVGIGTTATGIDGTLKAGSAVLNSGSGSDGTPVLQITSTLPTSPSAAVQAQRLSVTSAGSASQQQFGLFVNLAAGYTGNQRNAPIAVSSSVAGTSADYSASNAGVRAEIDSTSSGVNAAFQTYCVNRGSGPAIGTSGISWGGLGSGQRYGVFGAVIANPSSKASGVYALLSSTSSGVISPTQGFSALIADNGGLSGAYIILGNNAGTTEFSVNGAGDTFIGGWLQSGAGRKRLTADATNATATFSNLSDLSVTLVAGRKYTGTLAIKCNNSVAAEGIQLDFNGGTATMTSFWAAAAQLVGGTNVAGTVISTSLSGVINFSTITGETVLLVELSFVCNAAGTFIPRVAENSHSTGTLTVELGSNLWIDDMAN